MADRRNDVEGKASTSRIERPEPDEPGENDLTRTAESGGIEVRITEDHDDPPLGEQMDRTMQRMLHGNKKGDSAPPT